MSRGLCVWGGGRARVARKCAPITTAARLRQLTNHTHTRPAHPARSFPCPITGTEKELFVFQPQRGGGEGAALNVLDLSRTAPDIRGGLALAGSEPAIVESQRSIRVSERRVAEWGAAQ